MSEAITIPPDFEMVEHTQNSLCVKHRVSGRCIALHACQRPEQAELDYMVGRKRIEYRRDRLFAAVGKDITAFRAKQFELRQRGFAI